MVQTIDEDTLMREIDPSLYADETEEKRGEKEKETKKKEKEPGKKERRGEKYKGKAS